MLNPKKSLTTVCQAYATYFNASAIHRQYNRFASAMAFETAFSKIKYGYNNNKNMRKRQLVIATLFVV